MRSPRKQGAKLLFWSTTASWTETGCQSKAAGSSEHRSQAVVCELLGAATIAAAEQSGAPQPGTGVGVLVSVGGGPVGVAVAVLEGVRVAVEVRVGRGVPVKVGVKLGVEVGVLVLVAEDVGVAVCDGVSVGVGRIAQNWMSSRYQPVAPTDVLVVT